MDAAAKQQIVERLKQSNNVLVTVSNNPTVDQLSACIGTTLLLNKLGKHATAVFSGQVPSTIEFLQPEKTIEKNTDSLRDFIISLDKSKADKLRYKVEDQVVRIFITPYRSKISQADLVFSEGDYNVEVVLALGVTDRSQIDTAITTHGRILHDATVVSVLAGNGPPTNVGQINWQDPNASSLSEMVVSISEAFGTSLIDGQMATAFLTGIVAQTDRFSNDHTTPRVMTMSAQLMAAGANQQLIATKLEETPAAPTVPQGPLKEALDKATGGDVLSISHDKEQPPAKPSTVSPSIQIDEKGDIVQGPPPPKLKPLPTPKPPSSRTASKTGASSPPKTPPPPPPPMPQPIGVPPPPPPAPPPPPPAPPANPVASLPSVAKSRLPLPTPLAAPPPPPPPSPPASPPTNGRTYLDPKAFGAPSLGGSFSSTTETSSAHSLGGGDNPAEGGTVADNLYGTPASPTPAATTVDSARSAVATAIQSAPFDPAFNRVESLGSQPVGLDIHPEGQPAAAQPPAPNNTTPSLELPIYGSTPPLHDKPEGPPSANPPPPTPPPLMPTAGA